LSASLAGLGLLDDPALSEGVVEGGDDGGPDRVAGAHDHAA
jgi:hypothetical protein